MEVIFEETRVVRKVIGVCKTCQKFEMREWGQKLSVDCPRIVSPLGLVHGHHEIHSGNTSCGKDATGDNWWWSL